MGGGEQVSVEVVYWKDYPSDKLVRIMRTHQAKGEDENHVKRRIFNAYKTVSSFSMTYFSAQTAHKLPSEV